MAIIEVDVPTPDGRAGATLHTPEGAGPWPGVILFVDAGGPRPVFRQMGDHLAAEGYVVLVPDIYYRSQPYEPFDASTAFVDPDERARLGTLAGALSPTTMATDAAAFADFLHGRPEVDPGPLGTTGYCLGGNFSLKAAGYLGDRVGAAASFHGGRLAVADDPDSPHQLAGDVRAVVYVGWAQNDGSFDDEAAALLDRAYTAAGVDHTLEQYAAHHGFAVADNPTYDEAADERHWTAMVGLYRSALG